MQNRFTTTFSKAPEYTYIHTEKTEEILDEIKHWGIAFDDLSVIEKARMAQSSRLLSKNIDDITKDDILTFCAEDIEIPKIKPSNVVKMGFCS